MDKILEQAFQKLLLVLRVRNEEIQLLKFYLSTMRESEIISFEARKRCKEIMEDARRKSGALIVNAQIKIKAYYKHKRGDEKGHHPTS